MFGLLQLLSYDLDLDAPWVAAQEFDLVSDAEVGPPKRLSWNEPSWQTCLAWFVPFLKHSVDSSASAIHLLADHKGGCLRQLIWVPCNRHERQYEWVELCPMPWPLVNVGIRAVRMIAFMMPWSKRGVIRYRYKGKWSKARCVQESADDLVIYFTENRPTIQCLTSRRSGAN